MSVPLLRFFLCAPLLVSCQTPKPYAPPAQHAAVEAVEIEVKEFHGRPEAYAVVKGNLSTSMAQLVDSKQSREGNRLYIEVFEQTPRGASILTEANEVPTFEKKIPLELLGLLPGHYIVSANGVETTMELPAIRAEAYRSETPASATVPPVKVIDEFIAIEDSSFVEPQYSGQIPAPQ